MGVWVSGYVGRWETIQDTWTSVLEGIQIIRIHNDDDGG